MSLGDELKGWLNASTFRTFYYRFSSCDSCSCQHFIWKYTYTVMEWFLNVKFDRFIRIAVSTCVWFSHKTLIINLSKERSYHYAGSYRYIHLYRTLTLWSRTTVWRWKNDKHGVILYWISIPMLLLVLFVLVGMLNIMSQTIRTLQSIECKTMQNSCVSYYS